MNTKKVLTVILVCLIILSGIYLLLRHQKSQFTKVESISINSSLSTDVYEGEVVVSGRYRYYKSDFSGDTMICFTADGKSAEILPNNSSNFCFENQNEAIQKLNIDISKFKDEKDKIGNSCEITGSVSVVISSYKAFIGPGDGFDTATLDQVIYKDQQATSEGCK